jgi:hypothetical protein
MASIGTNRRTRKKVKKVIGTINFQYKGEMRYYFELTVLALQASIIHRTLAPVVVQTFSSVLTRWITHNYIIKKKAHSIIKKIPTW